MCILFVPAQRLLYFGFRFKFDGVLKMPKAQALSFARVSIRSSISTISWNDASLHARKLAELTLYALLICVLFLLKLLCAAEPWLSLPLRRHDRIFACSPVPSREWSPQYLIRCPAVIDIRIFFCSSFALSDVRHLSLFTEYCKFYALEASLRIAVAFPQQDLTQCFLDVGILESPFLQKRIEYKDINGSYLLYLFKRSAR
ncbi:hypothetical protein L7F22_030581 [Adiantum nelumboides]|nr:hypothetical protein [Adiantum nelumboides]